MPTVRLYEIYYEKKDWPNAINCLNFIIAINQEDIYYLRERGDVYSNQAHQYIRDGNKELALKSYSNSLEDYKLLSATAASMQDRQPIDTLLANDIESTRNEVNKLKEEINEVKRQAEEKKAAKQKEIEVRNQIKKEAKQKNKKQIKAEKKETTSSNPNTPPNTPTKQKENLKASFEQGLSAKSFSSKEETGKEQIAIGFENFVDIYNKVRIKFLKQALEQWSEFTNQKYLTEIAQKQQDDARKIAAENAKAILEAESQKHAHDIQEKKDAKVKKDLEKQAKLEAAKEQAKLAEIEIAIVNEAKTKAKTIAESVVAEVQKISKDKEKPLLEILNRLDHIKEPWSIRFPQSAGVSASAPAQNSQANNKKSDETWTSQLELHFPRSGKTIWSKRYDSPESSKSSRW